MKNKMIVILFVVLILLTGCKSKTDDRITDEQRREVEETCRNMIAAWETDAQAYREGDEDAKASANRTAEDYNKYIFEHSYVWNGNIPKDIYALIEPIE